MVKGPMPAGEVSQMEEDMATIMLAITTDLIKTVAVIRLLAITETEAHHLLRPKVEDQHGVKTIDQIPDCHLAHLSPFQNPCMMADDRIVVATALNRGTLNELLPEEFHLLWILTFQAMALILAAHRVEIVREMIVPEMTDLVTTGHAEEKIEMTVVMRETETDSSMMIGAAVQEPEVAVEVQQENVIEVEFVSENHWKGTGSVTYTAGNGVFNLRSLREGELATGIEFYLQMDSFGS